MKASGCSFFISIHINLPYQNVSEKSRSKTQLGIAGKQFNHFTLSLPKGAI